MPTVAQTPLPLSPTPCATTQSAAPLLYGQIVNVSASRASRTTTVTSAPPPPASSKLPKRRHPKRSRQRPHPFHPLSHSTSSTQVCTSSAATKITPADGKTAHSRHLTGRSEFKPPRRCKGWTRAGLGNGPDALSARAAASPGMENGHLTLRRYSLSAPCSLFFYFT